MYNIFHKGKGVFENRLRGVFAFLYMRTAAARKMPAAVRKQILTFDYYLEVVLCVELLVL